MGALQFPPHPRERTEILITAILCGFLLAVAPLALAADRVASAEPDPISSMRSYLEHLELGADFVTQLYQCDPSSLGVDLLSCQEVVKRRIFPAIINKYGAAHHDDPGFDKFLHCSVTCSMWLTCDSHFVVGVIGNVKEYKDSIDQFLPSALREKEPDGTPKDGNAEPLDMLANFHGLMTGYSINKFQDNQTGQRRTRSPEQQALTCATACKSEWYPLRENEAPQSTPPTDSPESRRMQPLSPQLRTPPLR
jgi:hypothetical protein